ncbi:MAG: serine/threonine protein kinase [Polyangiaceae bacterium]|nr:serine/threonine protein kinase [Polyangiaceae bacterium]
MTSDHTSLFDRRVSLAGRVLVGRYKLDRHLADGGMGAIWTAQDLTHHMPVAVKLMSVEGAMRADLRARFEQEAKAVALLRHPHIVEVLDYGTDEDTPFIVMELLEGMDLLAATREHTSSWPLTEIAGLVIQVAQGLGAAHRAGLIHRDVKPANIFLARSDIHGEVVAKVIDFGIAKWSENKEILTAANVALGSPSYMSPEQIRGRQLDARCDAWALAVVAFALVTGDMPFVGRNGPDIAKQVVLGNRRKIAAPIENARALERFFTRAFATDPDQRYRSVEELAGEFIRAAGAPSSLRTAARAVAEARGDLPDAEPHEVSDDSTTNRLERPLPVKDPSSAQRVAFDLAEDLEQTEIDDRLNPSGAAAGRTRSSG